MRLVMLVFAAFAAAWSTAPAQAVVISVSGVVSGTTQTLTCQFGPICQETSFSRDDFFVQSRDININVVDGVNSFVITNAFRTESFQGTFVNSGGVFTGIELFYVQDTCPTSSCVIRIGRSTRFNVSGGIPEPTTWLMLIGGFGLIGGVMRDRFRRGAAVA